MPRGNFVLGLPAGPAGGVSRRGPAAGFRLSCLVEYTTEYRTYTYTRQYRNIHELQSIEKIHTLDTIENAYTRQYRKEKTIH